MSKLLKWMLIIIISVLVIVFATRQSQAGPFKGKQGMSDLFIVAIPAMALGMTMQEENWDGTIQFAQSFLPAQLVTAGLQPLVKERRPNGNKNGFPSGHATAAFSGATFVHKRYGIKRAILPYLMAGFVGWQRIESRSHYTHDVIAGAAISAAFTWLLVDEYKGVNFNIESDGTGAKLNFNTKF